MELYIHATFAFCVLKYNDREEFSSFVRFVLSQRKNTNFHSWTVHLDIIKVFLVHQRMHYVFS